MQGRKSKDGETLKSLSLYRGFRGGFVTNQKTICLIFCFFGPKKSEKIIIILYSSPKGGGQDVWQMSNFFFEGVPD